MPPDHPPTPPCPLFQPVVGHVVDLKLCHAALDKECVSALARAAPLLRSLSLADCDLRGGSLDGLSAIAGLTRLSLCCCHGAAVGYAASLALFKRGFGRPLELSVDRGTVESMRTSAEELRKLLSTCSAVNQASSSSARHLRPDPTNGSNVSLHEGGLVCVGSG